MVHQNLGLRYKVYVVYIMLIGSRGTDRETMHT